MPDCFDKVGFIKVCYISQNSCSLTSMYTETEASNLDKGCFLESFGGSNLRKINVTSFVRLLSGAFPGFWCFFYSSHSPLYILQENKLLFPVMVHISPQTKWSFSQITQIWHFCIELTSRSFKRFKQKIKLPPVGIEFTIDHHWFRSLMLIQLCQPDICWIGDSLNWILFHVPSCFGLGSYLESIEHDFIRIWKSETGKAWQISTIG